MQLPEGAVVLGNANSAASRQSRDGGQEGDGEQERASSARLSCL